MQDAVDKLRENEKNNEAKIKKITVEKDAILGVNEDSEGTSI